MKYKNLQKVLTRHNSISFHLHKAQVRNGVCVGRSGKCLMLIMHDCYSTAFAETPKVEP